MSAQLSISNKYFLTKENIYKKIDKYNRFIDNKKHIQKPVVNTIKKDEKIDDVVFDENKVYDKIYYSMDNKACEPLTIAPPGTPMPICSTSTSRSERAFPRRPKSGT